MSNNQINHKQKINYYLELESIFTKKYKVVTEIIKERLDTIINIKLSNWIFTEASSELDFYIDDKNQLAFEWVLSWNKQHLINWVINKDTFDKDIDLLVFDLTFQLQTKLLEKNVELLINSVKDKWIDIQYRIEEQTPKIVFCLFNKDNPRRRVNIYLDKWVIREDFENIEENQWLVFSKFWNEVHSDKYEFVSRWLVWEDVLEWLL